MSIDTRPASADLPAAHEHRRAVRRVARIAVGIAAGDDADAMRARGGVGAAVADAVVGLQILHGDQLASAASSPAQPEHVRRVVRKRRRTVEHDAGTNDIRRRLRVADDAGRVGHRARIRQTAAGALERRSCSAMPSSSSARAKCVISRSAATLRRTRQALGTLSRTSSGAKPRRFMPVLTLTKTSSGRGRRRRLQHAHLLVVVHDDGEAALRDLRQLARARRSLRAAGCGACSDARAARSRRRARAARGHRHRPARAARASARDRRHSP